MQVLGKEGIFGSGHVTGHGGIELLSCAPLASQSV
jgi:hypothetical protein